MTSNQDDPGVRLLRAYLDAVSLSEEIQGNLWRTAELTLTQVRAMRRLVEEAKPLGQLGVELGLAPPSVTRLVDRLEERGLLERVRAGEDRRKVLASLTAAGRQLVGAVPPLLKDTPFHAAVGAMSRADQERILAALHDFSAAVRRAQEEDATAGARR